MGFSFEAISSKRKLGPETSNKGQDTGTLTACVEQRMSRDIRGLARLCLASDWPAPLPSGVAVTEHRWLMTDS